MKLLVNIDVPALEPAIEFYCAALGLRYSRALDEDIAELAGASSLIYLLVNPAGSSVAKDSSERRHYDRHWTPVHLDFVVDDLSVAAKRARDAGARQEGECMEWNGSRCITFADPFGHGFCLIEFDDTTYHAGGN